MGANISNLKECCCKTTTENKNCEREVEDKGERMLDSVSENVLLDHANNPSKTKSKNLNSVQYSYQGQNSSILNIKNSNNNISNQNLQQINKINELSHNIPNNSNSNINITILNNIHNSNYPNANNHNSNINPNYNPNPHSRNNNNNNLFVSNNLMNYNNNSSNTNNNNNNNFNSSLNNSRPTRYDSRIKIFHLKNLRENDYEGGDNLNMSQIEPEAEFINQALKRNLKTIMYKGNELIKQLSSFAGIGLSPYRRTSTKNMRHKTIDGEYRINEFSEGYLKKEDEAFLKESISKSISCVNLPGFDEIDFTEKIINRMIFYRMTAGKILYNEHEESCYFYIIKSGKFGFFVNHTLKAVYERGMFLGDFSLLNNNNKVNSEYEKWCIRCIEDAEIFIISSSDLKSIQEKYIKELLNNYLNCINTHPYLKYLSLLDRKLLSEELKVLKLTKNTIIQDLGLVVDTLYFISSGSIEINNIFGETLFILNKGEVFNEEFCLLNMNSAYEFKVQSDKAVLFTLSKTSLVEMMGVDFQREIIFNVFYNIAINNPILKELAQEFNFGNESVSYFQKPKRPNNSANYNSNNIEDCNNKSSSLITASNMDNKSRKSKKSSNSQINNTMVHNNNKNNNNILNNVNQGTISQLSKLNKKLTNKSDLVNKNYQLYNKSYTIKSLNAQSQISPSHNNIFNQNLNTNTNIILNNINNQIAKILDDSFNGYNVFSLKNPYRNLFDKFTLKKYPRGKQLFFYDSKKCSILLQGTLQAKNPNNLIYPLTILGQDFQANNKYEEVSTPDGCVILESDSIKPSKESISNNIKYIKKILELSQLLKFCSNKTLNNLAKLVNIEKYSSSTTIKAADAPLKKFYYVILGKIVKVKNIQKDPNLSNDKLDRQESKEIELSGCLSKKSQVSSLHSQKFSKKDKYKYKLLGEYLKNSVIGENEVFQTLEYTKEQLNSNVSTCKYYINDNKKSHKKYYIQTNIVSKNDINSILNNTNKNNNLKISNDMLNPSSNNSCIAPIHSSSQIMSNLANTNSNNILNSNNNNNNLIKNLTTESNITDNYALKVVINSEYKECIALSISIHVLLSSLDPNIIEFLKYNVFNDEEFLKTLDFNQVKILSFLGKGSYGKVNLIKYNNNRLFALKSIKKKMLVKKKVLVDYLYEEKKAMSMCCSPFIISNLGTFKDNFYVYFMMEYVHGQNFRSVSETNLFKHNKDSCFFYFANIILMLEHLKKQNILHRDIKTGNMIIRTNGYLKLIDFGLCKITKDYAYTIIGSPFYMSPEVIKGKGYHFSCDYWSLGIVLYELYYGTFPFGKNCYTTMEVYNQIVNNELTFPAEYADGSYDMNSLLKKLLNKNVKDRISSLKDAKYNVHKFDWDGLIDMTLEPPYKPIVSLKYYNNKDCEKPKSEYNNNLFLKENQDNYYENVLTKSGMPFDLCYMDKSGKKEDESLDFLTNEEDLLFNNF